MKKKEFNLPPEAFVITMVGRLHTQKDHRTLISAFQLITSILQNAYLLIVGQGPLRKKLQQYSQALGIDRRTRFLGFRRDIPAILAITDVVVLSTHWEGLPLILLEAMASAKPVIATDISGNREVILDGKTGLLVPPRDPEILAQAITKLAKDPKKAKEMGEKGLLRVAECFSFEMMVKKTIELYESLNEEN
jgi:glycosyltransferase involved in cell wall biosynthesis